jgi:hypothetical protein
MVIRARAGGGSLAAMTSVPFFARSARVPELVRSPSWSARSEGVGLDSSCAETDGPLAYGAELETETPSSGCESVE